MPLHGDPYIVKLELAGRAARLWARLSGFWILEEAENFFFSKSSRLVLGPPQPCIHGGYFLWVQQPAHCLPHSSPLSAMSAWSASHLGCFTHGCKSLPVVTRQETGYRDLERKRGNVYSYVIAYMGSCCP
jgi:hypothetical protein